MGGPEVWLKQPFSFTKDISPQLCPTHYLQLHFSASSTMVIKECAHKCSLYFDHISSYRIGKPSSLGLLR